MLPLQLAADAPWRRRFSADGLLWSQQARLRPERGLVAASRGGVAQLYLWDGAHGLHQRTNQTAGQVSGTLDPLGSAVYYHQDETGDETGHYIRLPYFDGPPTDITPNLPAYTPSGHGLAFSAGGRRMALNVTTSDGFALYDLTLTTTGEPGPPRLLYRGDAYTVGPLLSADGQLILVATTGRSQKVQYSLLVFDSGSGELVAELWDGPDTSVRGLMFSPVPGDHRLLGRTNRSGKETLFLWQPLSGERTDFTLPVAAGVWGADDWSSDGQRLLLHAVNRARDELYVFEPATAALSGLPEVPAGSIFGARFGPQGTIQAHMQSSTMPNHLVELNGEKGTPKRLLLPPAAVPAGRPWQSVTFPSSDGELIQGWLGLPEGDGPFPAVLEMPGGPEGVQLELFSPAAGAWLDHGVAYLVINYRGSVTFGPTFQGKIWGDPGHWEVEDVAAAGRWLVSEGIARPEAIVLAGWSYGAFLALLAAGKYPTLWAAIIAGLAITDWAAQYEDSAEMLRGYLRSFFGGEPAAKPEAYRRSSPITYAESVLAPILILQGRNDVRTPPRPVRAYEARLKALGKAIEVIWFDAGHGAAAGQADLAMFHQEQMLRFVQHALGRDTK